MSDWKYYNHALIPSCAPHEIPDESQLKEEFKKNKKALFARWTTDWDCGYETNWWYVIKDEPFDIDKLKSKRRYEINKGLKNFEVRVIKPKDYIKDLYKIYETSVSLYPKKYRQIADIELFTKWMNKEISQICFGAFNNDRLCGYALLNKKKKEINFSMLKVMQEFEKLGINAALVYEILMYFNNELSTGLYIVDGQKSILHETNFQNYLEKYFEFRKAYCSLHIKYRWFVRPIIIIMYPVRKLVKTSNNRLLYKIYSILQMEEISRNCKKWRNR